MKTTSPRMSPTILAPTKRGNEGEMNMDARRVGRFGFTALVALTIASVGLLGGSAEPALAKGQPRVRTFFVDSRGGVMYNHRTKRCRHDLDGAHVKILRVTLTGVRRAGYRPCPKCKPVGYKRPPKRFYASKWSRYYSQNRRAHFITAHRGGRLKLTWKQVVRRRLVPDPKTKPYGWVGFRSYYQAEPASYVADLIGEINRERAVFGNPPVSISTTRSVAAESWARHLCRVRGVTGHATPHTSGMTWDTWQSVGAGWESVWYTHEPRIDLLNGQLEAGPTCAHVPAFVTEADIAYIGAGVVYQRKTRGWGGYRADCVQSDLDNLRGSSIEVTTAPLSVSTGATTTAMAHITPETPGDTFAWSIADSSVATLTAIGGVAIIQPLAAGSTTIHVRTGVSQTDATATITVGD
jgi:hypothetical protein